VRGTDSDHVLVLIDGVKVGSATLGATAFQDLPIEEVERIELVRGPRSSLYGSEAIGGVIQIFTRRGGGPLRPRLKLGAGSYQSLNGALGLSGGGERGWFDASLGFEETEGFNACSGELGCFTYEPDKDGNRMAFGSARAGYRFDRFVELDLRWLRSESDTEFDGPPDGGNQSKGVQQVLGASASVAPLEHWDIALSAGRSWDHLDVFYEGRFLDTFETERDSLSWRNDVYLGDGHLITAGVDYLQDRVDGTIDYEVDSRRNWGVFGQYQGEIGPHLLRASLRRDDNEQFGDQLSGDAAWGYGWENGLRLTLSYGTAFKAPTFNDLYFPSYGNPDLDPETSRSLEVGIAGNHPVGTWTLNAYQTEIDDLIATDAVMRVSTNVDAARIRGLEATASGWLGGWDYQASLTLMEPENRSVGSNEGNLLLRRAQQTFRLDLDQDFGRYRVGGTLFVAGRRYDDLANEITLDPYALVDLRADYRFSETLRLQGRIENLFNEDYETAAFYNQPGRGFYLTLRYQP
jgi:vitamin B12 transporter